MSSFSDLIIRPRDIADRLFRGPASTGRAAVSDLSEYMIHCRKTIREAFKQESLNRAKFIVVVDDSNKVVGFVSEGDFRRVIWNEVPLEEPVESVMNKGFVFFNEGRYTPADVRKIFLSTNIIQIPILRKGLLVDVIFRDDFDEAELKLPKPSLQIPVVVMAGGKGTRLDPFTRILPKPLIPIGDKPVIEIIMDRFAAYGVTDFYISVNDKEKMIAAFFEDFHNRYTISYIKEDSFLGTAGALKYLEGKFNTPFIVSNCDIIIDADYAKIYEFHKQGGYTLTLVGSMQHHVVPYGVCTVTGGGGQLKEIEEKPEYDFLANTGLYILNPEVLPFIPQGEQFNMTDLIRKLRDNNRRIGVYPISEESWIDVGQWEEYKKTIQSCRI